jgi:hypothetical protein
MCILENLIIIGWGEFPSLNNTPKNACLMQVVWNFKIKIP